MKKILILNGPNLNLLGTREPAQYGSMTLAEVEAMCRAAGERLGFEVECFQSNWEGALIDKIHEYGQLHQEGRALGCVFNPGAFTHTSVALHDAMQRQRPDSRINQDLPARSGRRVPLFHRVQIGNEGRSQATASF